MPAEIREVSFPLAARGYSRRVVDAYVERVNHVIAGLEADRSPRSAVRHALERVGGQVAGILDRAREAADEITATTREEGLEITARAKAEAAELVVNAGAAADRERAEARKTLLDAQATAETIVAHADAEAAERLRRSEEELAELREQSEARMEEIRAATDAVWHERLRLLDSTRETAARLEAVATKASVQFPRPEPVEAEPDSPTEPIPVVAEGPSEAAAKRKPRANAGVTRLPTRSRNGGTPRAS